MKGEIITSSGHHVEMSMERKMDFTHINSVGHSQKLH